MSSPTSPDPLSLPKSTGTGRARHGLEAVLATAKAHGCSVELIMRDISTVQYQPQRLWEWAATAADVTEAPA